MKKYLIIAPYTGESDPIFFGIREFHTEQVVLISDPGSLPEVQRIKSELERFKIPAMISVMRGSVWEEVFRIVQDTTAHAPKGLDVIVNISSGNGITSCAAASAAFVSGVKAFAVGDKGDVTILPVLKFTYQNPLSDRKMKLLQLLTRDRETSLEELSGQAKMSLSLVSYHVNGNLKSDGLKQLGLVETYEKEGRLHLQLSPMGNLLLRGCAPVAAQV